ncbi:helix-turn-helix transcriptional regulator [Paenibacillus flagellatus]|uniref:Transcriptional regulator n=1 Tax=Paenibacillus flagellatus TaxID=2211139 RepID=A0A2V5KBL7_9BACL|nr:YafY family protein [Paenibacillus flagellatus]PYI56951.1 transcriptional regulator [Paenibacillus flagellatus]
MRADRLVSILLLLQTYGRMTASELAQRLEVSERTIHRDMEALGAAGVPVTAERGTGGGWRLMDDYRTNLTGLREEEIAALFLAAPGRILDDLGLRRASEGALIKLLASLPGVNRRTAEYFRERIHIDTAGWHPNGESADALPALQEAVLQDRKAKILYEKGGGTTAERIVDPLGLVIKGSVWYLIAAVDGEDVRTYRLSRIVACELLPDTFVRPADFRLASYWDASTERFVSNLPRFEATLLVDAECAYHVGLWKYAKVLHRGEPGEDGRIPYRIRFQTEEEACRYALGLGANAELTEPAELRERIAELAAQAAERYR